MATSTAPAVTTTNVSPHAQTPPASAGGLA